MRRSLFALGLLLAGLNAASAQTWTTKPIKAVIPFSAGVKIN
jgi:tripartite-type tricarboxylate transporter receptor subunit TctC